MEHMNREMYLVLDAKAFEHGLKLSREGNTTMRLTPRLSKGQTTQMASKNITSGSSMISSKNASILPLYSRWTVQAVKA